MKDTRNESSEKFMDESDMQVLDEDDDRHEYPSRSTTIKANKKFVKERKTLDLRFTSKQQDRGSVKTTPQMTRFRDAKVCNNLAIDEIDDHRIQSDYKCKSGPQNPEGKNTTLGIASAW